MSDELTGRLVFSITGRDKGRAFILIGTNGQGFYLLADGKLRKMEKPKRKIPGMYSSRTRPTSFFVRRCFKGKNRRTM